MFDQKNVLYLAVFDYRVLWHIFCQKKQENNTWFENHESNVDFCWNYVKNIKPHFNKNKLICSQHIIISVSNKVQKHQNFQTLWDDLLDDSTDSIIENCQV